MNNQRHLLDWRKTYYSQSGEDGVLEYILSRLPERDGWCCEFGAWDGRYLSNTAHFIEHHGYKGILIEADAEKANALSKNMSAHPVVCLNAFVEPSGSSSLDNLLLNTPMPNNFDLLSIDIDGQDYRVWEGLLSYTPKIVIAEINIRALPDVTAIHNPEAPFQWGVSGTSLKSMTELAKRKGYALLAMVGCNGIFCRKEFLTLFYNSEPTVEEVFTYEGHKRGELSVKRVIRKTLESWRSFRASRRKRDDISLKTM